ncbi:MAG: MurR/RpiR family transcriptional regulator [Christensenella sp.]|uniref:MurR/RpiR family transcriptional regulator n=1 Tax=Christensenella sp. TaxID=1935934 RepID=UPI002B213AC2|nr:MurR/RpiR family transcriptional regulator [Christensenella sp.]MEA5003252.1 MurR/RpiR family transcriptional regulator [Christensenella sp.]
MKDYKKTVVPVIEKAYGEMTAVERNIADFFIHNNEEMDFSAKSIAAHLFVSEASLSRFAKKCGFKGYREFLYHYDSTFTKNEKTIDDLTKGVLNTYQELLNKSYALVDENQMRRIALRLSKSPRVFVYGMGSSGLAAQELKMRFMRLGLDVEAIVDSHIMKMNSVLVNERTLVIGISIKGKTQEVLSSLKAAKAHGAKTVLITGNAASGQHQYCDELLPIALTKNLEGGSIISPQFPIQIMVDIFYAFFLNTDFTNKTALHTETVGALKKLAD